MRLWILLFVCGHWKETLLVILQALLLCCERYALFPIIITPILYGAHSGTFGQEKAWTLGVPTTYQHPLKSRDLLLATEAVVTPSLPSSDRSGAESGGDEVSSGKKSQSRKLRAAVHAVQTVLTVTEMEDEVRTLIASCMYITTVSISTNRR